MNDGYLEEETEQDEAPALRYDADYWQEELRRYREEFEKWVTGSKKIIKRYRDDRTGSDTGARTNILWSNVRTLKPAVYARPPKVEVDRRNKDQNDPARVSAIILERAIAFELSQYTDYHSSLSQAVDDRLLPGRGAVWVRYEPEIETISEDVDASSEPATPQERIMNERTPVDFVHWTDFAHAPARTWDEVPWVARRVYMTRDEGVKRFGEIFKDVPLTHSPQRQDDDNSKSRDGKDERNKAVVWEIWCKTDRDVYWIGEHFDQVLDHKPDPLQLECFFPCPKPLYSTLTTDTLIPVPDFKLYQDQADELDIITARIQHLTKAMKVMGVYAADEAALSRLFKEGDDAVLIPITNWQVFAEKGGMAGAMQLVPLRDIIMALQQLYVARDACKQTIYEITGISDILRGASMASETATAQQIKSQFASIRLNDMKDDVARMARDVLRIKGEIICSKYQPEIILQISGILSTPDAEHAEQAMILLKNEPLRNYSIDIETDSLVEIDHQSEKASRMEFLQASSAFLEKAVMAAQTAPDIVPLTTQMLLFGIRGFRVGREIEGEFERFVELTKKRMENPEPTPPDPAMAKLEADQQKAQADMQLAQQQMQVDAQAKQVDMQLAQQKAQFEAQLEQQRLAFEKWKAELEAQTKIQIAAMQIESQTKLKGMEKANDLVAYDEQGNARPSPTIESVLKQSSETTLTGIQTLIQSLQASQAQQTQMLAALLEQSGRPRQVVRDAAGRISGVH